MSVPKYPFSTKTSPPSTSLPAFFLSHFLGLLTTSLEKNTLNSTLFRPLQCLKGQREKNNNNETLLSLQTHRIKQENVPTQ